MRPLSTSTRSSLAFLSHSILPFPLPPFLSRQIVYLLSSNLSRSRAETLSQFSLPKVVELSSLSTDPISSRTKISRSLARLIHLPSNDTRITNVDNLIATILGQCKSFFSFFFFILRILRSFPPRTKEEGEGYRELRFRNGREEKKRTEVARHRPLAFDASEWRLNGLQNDGQLHSPLSVAVEGGEVECRRAHS